MFQFVVLNNRQYLRPLTTDSPLLYALSINHILESTPEPLSMLSNSTWSVTEKSISHCCRIIWWSLRDTQSRGADFGVRRGGGGVAYQWRGDGSGVIGNREGLREVGER